MRMTRALLLVMLLIGGTEGNAQEVKEVKEVTITPLLTTTQTASGQRIRVPLHPQVVAAIYEIAPGVALPLHEHPYPRYAYVLAGKIEVAVAGGKTYRYQEGDFFAEVINQWHSGRNIGTTPVRLLVLDQVEPGHSNTIIKQDPSAP
jgi:quercetin dioxygenase-like cupin family protein